MDRTMRARLFHGWWMVIACLLAGLVGNALGLFGAAVYLHEVVTANGWRTSLVSCAVTLFLVTSALSLIPAGSGINRFGPRPVIALGGISMAAGVAGMGQSSMPWHVYIAFLCMGVGWACLSTTAIATILAPWFEKHQGRAMSIASLGASVGGMTGAPVLLFGIGYLGLTVGNVTTLAPIIVRREFGAAAFGAIFGAASCVIQLTAALGPGFYGLMFDVSGGYRGALITAAALDVVAAAIVLYDRRKPLPSPAASRSPRQREGSGVRP